MLEMDKAEESSRPVEFHQDIHIARLFLLSPNIGAEYPKVGNAISFPEFGQVRMEILPDLFNRLFFLRSSIPRQNDAPSYYDDRIARCYIF